MVGLRCAACAFRPIYRIRPQLITEDPGCVEVLVSHGARTLRLARNSRESRGDPQYLNYGAKVPAFADSRL